MLWEIKTKIDKILDNKYKFIKNNFSNNIFLCGGILRDLMVNQKPKDIDFFYTGERENVFKFIKDNSLIYKLNSFGNPKLFYENKGIDFAIGNEFKDMILYNVDGLFYDINKHKFILAGFEDFLASETVKIVNNELIHPNSKRLDERKKKIESFRDELKERGLFIELRKDIEDEELVEGRESNIEIE